MNKYIIALFLILLFISSLAFAKGNIIEIHPNSNIKFEMPNGWLLGEVAGVARLNNGEYVLFHRAEHQLLIFDKNRKFVREIGKGLFVNPHGLRVDSNQKIWVTDSGNHTVMKFANTGEQEMVIGRFNTAGEGWYDRDYNLLLLNQPLDMAIDSSGFIYIVDKGNSRIVKVDQSGKLVTKWGGKGSENGQFDFAHSIVIDKNNTIYIADRENKRIQLFDTSGKYIGKWTDIGYPYVLYATESAIWVTDARFEQVRKLSYSGTTLKLYQGQAGRKLGQFSSVHGIYVDEKNSEIVVSQIFNWGGVNRFEE